jgi:hypothetical protein
MFVGAAGGDRPTVVIHVGLPAGGTIIATPSAVIVRAQGAKRPTVKPKIVAAMDGVEKTWMIKLPQHGF